MSVMAHCSAEWLTARKKATATVHPPSKGSRAIDSATSMPEGWRGKALDIRLFLAGSLVRHHIEPMIQDKLQGGVAIELIYLQPVNGIDHFRERSTVKE